MSEVYAERVADDKDPLRDLLKAARHWQMPPTELLYQQPRVTTYKYNDAGQMVRSETVNYTLDDALLIMALEDYEAGFCSGGNHPLAETTKPEHADAYRPGERIRCHYCKAQAVLEEALSNEKGTAGLLVPLVLDPEVVARNRLPVPPLPPELRAATPEAEPTP